MSRHALAAAGGLALLAVAGMLWFRGGCTPETCGPLVGAQVRDLIALQEIHRVEHGAFATSIQALGLPAPDPVVRIELVHATDSGWIARGAHGELEGLGCVAWMGVVPAVPETPRGTRAEEPARSYCDFPT